MRDFEFFSSPGEYGTATILADWVDESRGREVPVKFYYPREAEGKLPVIVFSHGLGGSRESYAYFGRHWASHGYICVHLQHRGTDEGAWANAKPEDRMQAMRDAANFENTIVRPPDVSFVLDQIAKIDAEPLAERFDLDNVGISGHSYGARTTMSIAGQLTMMPDGEAQSFADKRVKAALTMSPMPPKDTDLHDRVFAPVSMPVMHMTGDLDTSPIEIGRTAEERLVPYMKSPSLDQYLLIFRGGDHMVFSGRPRGPGLVFDAGGDPELDDHFRGLMKGASQAYWDAFLKGDLSARQWLDETLSSAMGEWAEVRQKVNQE